MSVYPGNNAVIIDPYLRQKNVDYSICQALSYTSARIDKALVIYDVACQWYAKFAQRVEACPGLQTPEDLEIVPAVGKFHLSAHKLECFSRFSLMFVQGVGHIDGEILETLWASFNKISTTARSMSLAHRQEVYDDHMRDSNWKKLVGMGLSFFFQITQVINVISQLNVCAGNMTLLLRAWV